MSLALVFTPSSGPVLMRCFQAVKMPKLWLFNILANFAVFFKSWSCAKASNASMH